MKFTTKAYPRRIIYFFPHELRMIIRYIFSKKIKKEDYIDKFTKALADYISVNRVELTNSGSTALKIILTHLKIPHGSKIIIPAYTDESVPDIIESMGLSLVPVDISLDDHNMLLDEIEKKIDDSVSAIIVTHLFGRPFDVERLKTKITKRKIFIIEDCAHAIGSYINEKHVGSSGDASYFSFSSTKPFNTFNGGAFWLKDWSIYRPRHDAASHNVLILIKDVIINIILFIATKPHIFSLFLFPCIRISFLLGFDISTCYKKTAKKMVDLKKNKRRFTNFQAYIGFHFLHYYDEIIRKQTHNALFLEKNLCKHIPVFHALPTTKPNYYFFTILSPDNNALRKKLISRGIDTGIDIMRKIHTRINVKFNYPNTELIWKNSIQIPVYPNLKNNDIKRIAKAINECYVKQ